jgi:probable blue pigment (indigoidine) exporter
LSSILALKYIVLVLNNRLAIVLVTALAPAVWGSTYLVTTELLPPDRPLLAAVVRALPAGLALVALTRRLPSGVWWWRALVLGTLNIGAFFALLFVAAYRLPGGVAATIGALQPFLVALLAAGLLGQRLTARTTIAAAAGVVGVGLLVLRANAHLDVVGMVAALGGAVAMAAGVVLSKRWPPPAPLLATTGWQLVAGGLVLVPVALVVEGLPTALTPANLAGYAYLTVIGSAFAYALWFRGIRALSPTEVTFLGLLSPVVATTLGWLVLGQELTATQALGAAVVLGALVAAQIGPRSRVRIGPGIRSIRGLVSGHDDRGGHVVRPEVPMGVDRVALAARGGAGAGRGGPVPGAEPVGAERGA